MHARRKFFVEMLGYHLMLLMVLRALVSKPLILFAKVFESGYVSSLYKRNEKWYLLKTRRFLCQENEQCHHRCFYKACG